MRLGAAALVLGSGPSVRTRRVERCMFLASSLCCGVGLWRRTGERMLYVVLSGSRCLVVGAVVRSRAGWRGAGSTCMVRIGSLFSVDSRSARLRSSRNSQALVPSSAGAGSGTGRLPGAALAVVRHRSCRSKYANCPARLRARRLHVRTAVGQRSKSLSRTRSRAGSPHCSLDKESSTFVGPNRSSIGGLDGRTAYSGQPAAGLYASVVDAFKGPGVGRCPNGAE